VYVAIEHVDYRCDWIKSVWFNSRLFNNYRNITMPVVSIKYVKAIFAENRGRHLFAIL
jgi:hypothetical protein